MFELPLVTAVIPTRGLPELAVRAVRSALAQTHQQIEVMVVMDGPDQVTSKALAEIVDSRRALSRSRDCGCI